MAMRWMPAYVGLGSNLDDPPRNIERAFDALAELPQTRFVKRSRCYRSVPMGPQEQPHFINAVAGLVTQLAPDPLLMLLKEIEVTLGRAQPVVRWGPRVIDLDLLVYGDARIQTAAITVPHPGLRERNWVLHPLADIAPDLEVPGVGRVRRLAAAIGQAGLEAV